MVVGLFVVRRHELTDESWAAIEPLLAPPRMGRPVRDRRQVVNGIYLACDGQGCALAFTLTAGNVNDCTQFEQVMTRIRIKRRGPRRPRTKPERAAANEGYSSTKIRTYLRRRGIKAAIPERIDQINGRIRRDESPSRPDRAAYRRHNVVERCPTSSSTTKR
ncbi:transposase [Streptomyces griseorubens]